MNWSITRILINPWTDAFQGAVTFKCILEISSSTSAVGLLDTVNCDLCIMFELVCVGLLYDEFKETSSMDY